MDFNHLSNELEKASIFDLWRIKCVIDNQMNDPDKLLEAKKRLYPNQEISYFDSEKNHLIDAIVIEVNAWAK